MLRALRMTGWLPALLVVLGAYAHAQSPAHGQWIRTSTQKVLSLFLSQGISALHAGVQACYLGADRQRNVDAFILEAERCTAEDHLDLILFTAEKNGLKRPARLSTTLFSTRPHKMRG